MSNKMLLRRLRRLWRLYKCVRFLVHIFKGSIAFAIFVKVFKGILPVPTSTHIEDDEHCAVSAVLFRSYEFTAPT